MDEVKKNEEICGRDQLWLYYQNSVQNLELNKYWKKYIGELAFDLCGSETELGDALVNKNELTSCDPLKSPELLKLFNEKDLEVLKGRIWNAQIKVCLPMIEMERCSYITINYQLLQGVMSSEYWDDVTKEYKMLYKPVNDEDLGDPYELSLDTLVKMANFKKRLIIYGTVSTAPFIRMKENSNKRIAFLSDLLNRLTHYRLCKAEELDTLFAGHENFMKG